MKKIKLNYYTRAGRVAFTLLALSALLFYWGITGSAPFTLFKLESDSMLFRGSLCTLSFINLFPFYDIVIKWISVLRYGEFCICMNKDTITFPGDGRKFRGFKRITLQKSELSCAELQKKGKYVVQVLLKDKDNMESGTISGQLAALQTLSAEEIVTEINT